MSSMIYFSNPGVIDTRVISTMGVNVKEGNNPIGVFGTGLKYAIATLLREGQEVEIWAGVQRLKFEVRTETIRGAEFGIVYMNGEPLGFTTALGKNWTLEMAYRELWSNCKDEGGAVEDAGECVGWHELIPVTGCTVVLVTGDKFYDCHLRRWEFLLNPERKPLYSNDRVEIYAGKSNRVFYRGIAAYNSDTSFQFTYNIKCQMQLTEDRTMSGYTVMDLLADCLAKCTDEEIIEHSLLNKESLEAQDYHLCYVNEPSPTFNKVVTKALKTQAQDVNDRVLQLYRKTNPEKLEWEQVELSDRQRKEFEDKAEFCESIGFNIRDYPVKFSKSLGDGTLGRAYDGTIWVALRAFEHDELVRTLIEEWVHLNHKVGDGTREMQDVLIGHIVRLGGKLTGNEVEGASKVREPDWDAPF